MSTLLVSLSFAMGKSVSAWVEGLLLIAVQRPFALGDRITITSASTVANPGAAYSWFVEDINLYSTTLRFAATNEICTIPNGTLCTNRIVNCTRSPGAVVTVDLELHLEVLDGDNMEVFVQSLRTFVQDNPRIWESVGGHRISNIDFYNEKVYLRVAVKHRNGWHSAARVIQDRGVLVKFLNEVAGKMNCDYDTAPPARLIYNAGSLKKGSVRPEKKYGKYTMTPDNIVNFSAKKVD